MPDSKQLELFDLQQFNQAAPTKTLSEREFSRLQKNIRRIGGDLKRATKSLEEEIQHLKAG
tara:strand:- start:172 stop:354 length:183 start_codon:yes stop_codon:yes gene_type:complete